MTPPRLPNGEKKETRLTVLFTASEMEKLERICAFHNLSKSVAAHDLVMKGLAEGFEQIDDNALVVVEERAETWRRKIGLE